MSAVARLWNRAPLWRFSLYMAILCCTSFLLYPPPVPHLPPARPAHDASSTASLDSAEFRPSILVAERPVSAPIATQPAEAPAPAPRFKPAPQVAAPSPSPATPAPVPQGGGLALPDPTLSPPTPNAPKSGYGSLHRRSFDIDGRRVPLPQGEFRVVSHTTHAAGLAQGSTTALINIESDMLKAAVVVVATPVTAKVETGFRAYKDCSRTDMHFVSVKANEDFGKQDCYYVNHIWPNGWRGNDSGAAVRALANELGMRNLPIPPALVQVTFIFGDKNGYLRVWYNFNPQARGIASNFTASWNESDWHKSFLARDARKLEYVAATQRWAEAWYPYLRSAFFEGSDRLPAVALAAAMP